MGENSETTKDMILEIIIYIESNIILINDDRRDYIFLKLVDLKNLLKTKNSS